MPLSVDEASTAADGKASTAADGKDEYVHPNAPLETSHYVALFLAVAIPNAALMLSLSGVGWGFEVYNAVAPFDEYGFRCLASVFAIALLYWIFDWVHWTGAHQAQSVFPLWILFCAALMLFGRKWPSLPILMILGQKSICIAIVRINLARHVGRTRFFTLVAAYQVVAGIALLTIFLYWYFDAQTHEISPTSGGSHQQHNWTETHEWGHDMTAITKNVPQILAHIMPERPLNYTTDCGPDAVLPSTGPSAEAEAEQIIFACAQLRTVFFMVWFSPVIACGLNLAIGLFLYTHTKALHVDDPEQFEVQIKEYLLIIGGIVVALFVAGEVGGEIHAAGGIMAVFSLFLVVMLGWMYMELGPGADDHDALVARMQLEKDLQKMEDSLESGGRTGLLLKMVFDLPQNEWAQAMFLGAIGPFIPVYFVLDVVRRRVRKCTGWGTASEDTEDTLTRGAAHLKDTFATWHIPIVLTKFLVFGEVVFLFQIGVSKGINVFLSWMNAWLLENGVSFPMCILIVFCVGFLMFLLPPVPGVPVYVFAGVVLGSQGSSPANRESIGFGGGAACAVTLSFVLKLVASLGQYGLGVMAGKNIKVQQLIGVDTIPTRAVESILQQPGLSLAKTAVLVGAPDWPTSVTCGILSMNITQMLLGTAPVFFVNTPCALAGAYLSKPNASGADELLSSFFLTFSAIMLGAGGCFAFFSIIDVIDKDGEELAKPREEHRAVAELTAQEKDGDDAFRQATQWNNLGAATKILLVVASSAMQMSTFAFMVGGARCFREFTVSGNIGDSFVDGGLNGDVANIVLPPGRIALGVFFFAVLLHVVISQLMGGMAKAQMAATATVQEIGLVEMRAS